MNYTSDEDFFRSACPTTDPGLNLSFEGYQETQHNAPVEGDANTSHPPAVRPRIHLWRTSSGSFQGCSPDEILVGLSHPFWERRLDAIRSIEAKMNRVGEEEIDALQMVARDDLEGQLRAAALEVLGKLEAHVPVAVFLVALTDPSWEVRATAARALGNQGERVSHACLLRALKMEDDESVREAIVRTLGKQKKTLLVDLFVRFLCQDKSWLVREAAAWALGELGENAPFHHLVSALRSDENESVRVTAAYSLGHSWRQEAERPLLEALHDEDEEVQRAAVWALQQLDEQTRGMDRWGSIQHFNASLSPFEEALAFSKKEKRSVQEKKKRFQINGSSPVWGESWEDLVLQALTQFMHNQRGFLCQSTLLDAAEGERILLLSCFYEHAGSFLQENVLRPVEQVTEVESLEAALQSQDEAIQTAVKYALDAWAERQWQDLLIVSFALLHSSSKEEKRECKPLRVVVSGMGCKQVRKNDPCVLPQMVTAWENTIEDSAPCQYPQNLTDLKVWYQPIAG